MTVLTMRRIRDHFVVTGPDIEPVTFKTRVEARDWCLKHYQGSPIQEVGGAGQGKERPIVRRSTPHLLGRAVPLSGSRAGSATITLVSHIIIKQLSAHPDY
jgi:hypothetical protein